MNDDKRIAVIGLGLMGTAITERLLEHGYSVSIWSRSTDEGEPLTKLGAVWSENPLAECDRVILSLYSSDVVADVIKVMSDDLTKQQIIVDTTTGLPDDAIALAGHLAQFGVKYLDAPISGSSEQTRRGEATVMVGGDRSDYDGCADLWPILGSKVFHVGTIGNASKMKLISNLVLGLNRASLAEGLSYAQAIGIQPDAALEVLKGSAAYSKAMDVKGRKMIDQEFSAQARLSQHAKDVRLILQTARQVGLRLPLSQCHITLLEQVEAAGFGDLDNSAIIKAYQAMAEAQDKT